MSHNISEVTGQAAFFSLKEKAWHGLGTVVSEAKSSEEVLEIAQLNWEVKKYPNLVQLGEELIDTGSVSTVRTDLNIVLGNRLTDKYEIMQNSSAFEFMDSLVLCDSDIIYNTAGALGKGEVVFVSAKLPNYIRIDGSDDIIENYLLLSNSHDASMSLTAMFTPIRVVCNNTLNMVLKNSTNKVVIRHTSSLHSRLEEGRKLLGLHLEYSEQVKNVLNLLSNVKVDETYTKNFVNSLMLSKEEMQLIAEGNLGTRKKNILDQMIEAIYSAPGQDKHEGTALHLYNGVTSYFQNVKEYKDQSRKMKGIMLGGDESLISQKALSMLLV